MMKEKRRMGNYVTTKEMIQRIMQGVFNPDILLDWPHLKVAAEEIYLQLIDQSPNFENAPDNLAIVHLGIAGIYRISQANFQRIITSLETIENRRISPLELIAA